jgi:nucleotide-binding universal stress UspA family protein
VIKVIVWISEITWESCIDESRPLLPEDAEVTLLHVTPGDVEDLAGAPAGLLGRHRKRAPGPPVRAIAAEEAQSLLSAALSRLGRPAQTEARRGHVERQLLDACADADLLVLARDGEPRLGPKSLGPQTRFVVDHVPCQVLLVWPGSPPSIEEARLPPHLRG